MQRLQNKTALITGAAAGIGAAAAKLFANEGARVFLVDKNEPGLLSIIEDIGPDRASSVLADVADEAATKKYVELARNYLGGIDIALLNAGIEGEVHPVTKEAHWNSLNLFFEKLSKKFNKKIIIAAHPRRDRNVKINTPHEVIFEETANLIKNSFLTLAYCEYPP